MILLSLLPICCQSTGVTETHAYSVGPPGSRDLNSGPFACIASAFMRCAIFPATILLRKVDIFLIHSADRERKLHHLGLPGLAAEF